MERQKGHLSSLQNISQYILSTVPRDAIPYFFDDKRSIFETLDAISSFTPGLNRLVEWIYRKEVELLTVSAQDYLGEDQKQALYHQVSNLPHLSRPIFSSILNKDQIFQLEHDLASPLGWVSGQHNLPTTYHNFFDRYKSFGELRYRLASVHNDKTLQIAYSSLTRDYAKEVILPSVQKALNDYVPFGTYELLETRSAFRELVSVSPRKFATHFTLLTAVTSFVKERVQGEKLRDKNTGKFIDVSFDPESTNPTVFMDEGDLYRMLRNLLRDAVTHGEENFIRPIVKVEAANECVYLSVYSAGHLEKRVLQMIGKKPYTTQDRGNVPHGYGKVGARKLLETLWRSIGVPPWEINRLLHDHWTNTTYEGRPHVRWKAPIPYAS